MRTIQLRLFSLSLAAATLAACGGGGSGGGGSVSSVSGRIIDGYIGGAIVCVDENNNWQCDAGEPSTRSEADGSYFLPYIESLDGKQILAVVPEGATDSDFPGVPILRTFNLVSPAEAADRVGGAAEVTLTPFTTMVSQEMMISGVSVTQAAETVRVEFGLAQSPLNFDFKSKSDDKALAAAQVLTSALARMQEQVTTAAESASVPLSAGEKAIASSRLVRQEVAPFLVKSNGDLAIQGCATPGSCTQAQLSDAVNTAATTVFSGISGRIQTIAAGTKSGTGTVADFAEVMSRGLVILEIDTSDFLYGSGDDLLRVNGHWDGYQNQVTAELVEFANNQLSTVRREVYFESQKTFSESDFSTDLIPGTTLPRIPNPQNITVLPGWYPTWGNVDNVAYWSRESNTWGERIQADGLESPTEVDRNCVRLTGEASGVSKACLIEKELTGRPLGEVFPSACQNGSSPISGCDAAAPMPAGSYGYNLQLEALSDNYEFWASAEWEGYNYDGKNWNNPASSAAPSLDRFIDATRDWPHTKASCRIAFKIDRVTPTTGTFNWAYNKDASCGNIGNNLTWNFNEKTDYVIKTVAGKEVMEVFVPNVYRAAKPGSMVANCKFAFAVVNRPVLKQGRSVYSMNVADYELPATPLPGIYGGDFCPANAKGVYEFTGNLNASSQFMSRIAVEFLASQRRIPLSGVLTPK